MKSCILVFATFFVATTMVCAQKAYWPKSGITTHCNKKDTLCIKMVQGNQTFFSSGGILLPVEIYNSAIKKFVVIKATKNGWIKYNNQKYSFIAEE